MIRSHQLNRRGSILILSMWVLAMLATFAVNIGLLVGQRIKLLSRLEDRSQLHFITESGFKMGLAVLQADLIQNQFGYTPASKVHLHNNPESFKNQKIGNGSFTLQYILRHGDFEDAVLRYGVSDEERRLNLNYATRGEIIRLLQLVVTHDESELTRIADGIIGWREFGDSQLSGFYSDDFYQTLDKPYSPKNAEFELFDELRLVQGVTSEVYEKLLPYVTIYGDGLVNVNTAPYEVLYALGLSDEAAQKLIQVRSGQDGQNATEDDFIFRKTYDIAAEVKLRLKLTPEEFKMIDYLNRAKKIKVDSRFFRIFVTSRLDHSADTSQALSVYNSKDNWIEYYYEK